ncbi:hypothetical protein QF001_000965 [Paraburkholderia youngii]|uniref:phage integrase Arm DNA-binding domain-containing protein n=1 Tax=Paraburkholderia youngii TaxID=2782701 RepID=UPI003D1D7019
MQTYAESYAQKTYAKMTLPIDELRKSLPPNLFLNPSSGQYCYRDPRNGRTKSLGSDHDAAVAYVNGQNVTNGVIKKGDSPKRFVRSAAFVEDEGLLSLEELAVIAQPIKQLCGVYLLLREGRVVYVGKSINCHGRIGTHFSERGKKFDAYHIIECAQKDLDRIETQYIAKFMPRYNVLVPKAIGRMVSEPEQEATMG